MAKNFCGFIQKKYRQPHYYRNLFDYYNAIYITENDVEIMVQAEPHFLCSERIGAEIDHYRILRQDKDCRRPLTYEIKTQKRAMELLEKFLLKY